MWHHWELGLSSGRSCSESPDIPSQKSTAEQLPRAACVGLEQQPHENPKAQYLKFLEWIIATYRLGPDEAQSLSII